MKNLLLLLLPASFAAVLLTGCYSKNRETLFPTSQCDTTTVVKYSTDIQPIMTQSCNYAGCHNAATKAGGYDLETFSSLKGASQSGIIMAVITHAAGVSPMPKNAPALSDCDISKINRWIAGGALQN